MSAIFPLDGGKFYRVDAVDPVEHWSDFRQGSCDTDDSAVMPILRISQCLRGPVLLETLIHEVVHLNDELDEDVVSAISVRVATILHLLGYRADDEQILRRLDEKRDREFMPTVRSRRSVEDERSAEEYHQLLVDARTKDQVEGSEG